MAATHNEFEELDVELASENSADAKARHVVVGIDISGSMSGIRLQKAKEGVIKLVDSLRDDESFTLVSFDSKVKELLPRTRKQDIKMAGVTELVMALQVGGMTAFYDAIQLCMRRLKSEHEERRQLVILTDGQDTASESSHDIAKAAVFEPDVADFVFVVMGINLDHSAHTCVAALCGATHCKMVSISTQSGRGLAVDNAFDMALTRITDPTTTSYDPEEGPLLRRACHSPVFSRSASTDVMDSSLMGFCGMSDDDDDSLLPRTRFRRLSLDMDSVITAETPPPAYQP